MKIIRKIAWGIANYLNLYLIRQFPRAAIKFIRKQSDGNYLTGAEIGVAHGANAKNILKVLPIKTLYLIDPYEEFEDNTFLDKRWIEEGCNELPALFEAKFTAKRRLEKYKNKIIWIKKKSEDALNDIPSNLDFVYIDGNHNYEFVKADMENYYEKLKVGGVLCGHDINIPEITLAFVDFVDKHNLVPYMNMDDWWIIKK